MIKSVMSGSTHANLFGRSRRRHRPTKAVGTAAMPWLNLQNDDDIQIMKRGVGGTFRHIEMANKQEAP
jgi:hypothetical protein